MGGGAAKDWHERLGLCSPTAHGSTPQARRHRQDTDLLSGNLIFRADQRKSRGIMLVSGDNFRTRVFNPSREAAGLGPRNDSLSGRPAEAKIKTLREWAAWVIVDPAPPRSRRRNCCATRTRPPRTSTLYSPCS